MDETDADQAQLETPRDGQGEPEKVPAERVEGAVEAPPAPEQPAARPRAKKAAPPKAGGGGSDASPATIVVKQHLTVVQRLIAVLADVPDLPKDRKAPENMGGYAFRGIESVTTAMRPLMAKHGVICLAKVRKRIESERKLSTGKSMYVIDLHIDWTFHGADGDTLSADSWGCGTDMGDKATQKAVTAAFKSLLTPTFFIGDGGTDAEGHSVAESSGSQRRTRGRAAAQRNAPPPEPPPDPEQWFSDNGWLDRTHHDEIRKEITETAKALADWQKPIFKEWSGTLNNGEGLRWDVYWPKPLAETVAARLVVLKDSKPPAAPQPPAPQPPAETPPAPEAPATAECVWCKKSVSTAAAVRGQAEGYYHEACAEEEATETAPTT